MKKGLTTLLVILLAIGAMLVSCKAEVATPADELVAVSFEESASRALSATLEEFDKADFYWYYVAAKTDSTGLISGQTASYGAAGAVAVSAGNTGLSYTVPGFSQGTWKFTLYAYLDANPSDKSAWVYSGEATGVVLQKGGDNKVTVIVNPNPEGNGTLFVDMAHIRLAEASEASHNLVSPTVSVEKGGTVYVPTSGNVEYVLATGTYKVTVTYFEGSISYASGSVMATVYPGLKTTVTGYVDELITYAQFDAKQNPDIVKETWGTTKITTEASGTVALTQKAAESETNKVVSANLPATAAVDKLKELADNVGADSYATSSMKLNLSVDTSVVTETAVTYDIGMEAELTYSKNGQSSIAKSDVKNVTDYVMVEINLASDITNVSVTHSGFDMIRTDNMSKAGKDGETDPKYVDINVGTLADPLWKGFYLYDSVNKKLYIKTKSFSPFAVTLSMTDYVAVMDGTKYTSLADAVNAVDDDEPHAITLLKDFSGAGIGLFKDDGDTARNIVIDLGGHTFTCSGPAVGSAGTQNQAVHLEKGNTVTIKNGTITSVAEATSGVKMLIQNYSNLTLEDVTLDGTKLAASSSRYVLSNNCGEVLICGSTSITAPAGGYALDVYDWRQYYPEGVKVTIDTEGTILGWLALNADGVATTPYRDSITIKNGNFGNMVVYREKGSLSISGGTFTGWNPTGCVAEGYAVVSIGSSVWEVVPAVAKIGSVYYATLQSALNAAEDGDTVELLNDITVSSPQTISNKDIVLDGNSYSLISTQTGSGEAVRTLTVSGSKSITLKDITIKGNNHAAVFGLKGSSDARCKITITGSTFVSGHKALYFIGCENADIVITDCDSRGIYGFNVDSQKNLTWSASKSTFGGWNSSADVFAENSFVFTECEFVKSNGYCVVKPYGSAIYNECKFAVYFRDHGVATGLSVPITVNFNDCLVENADGSYDKLNKEILGLMFNYDITSGSSSGASTINNQYWYINGECVYQPTVTEQVED